MTIMDQCAAGLTDPGTNLPIRKPTEFWASDFCLIERLSQVQCRYTLQHATLEGTYKGVARTHMTRVWPWKLVAAVASGVSALIRRQYTLSRTAQCPGSNVHMLYPARESKPRPEKKYPPFELKSRSRSQDWECPGCARSRPSENWLHTRDPRTCKFPDVENSLVGV